MFPILLGKNNDLEKRVKTLEDSGGDSSGGGVLVVTADNRGKLNKTWQEIYDAEYSVLKMNDEGGLIIVPCTAIINNDEGLAIQFYNIADSQVYTFVADSTDSYPIIKHSVE